jgi:hypothetical protein
VGERGGGFKKRKKKGEDREDGEDGNLALRTFTRHA